MKFATKIILSALIINFSLCNISYGQAFSLFPQVNKNVNKTETFKSSSGKVMSEETKEEQRKDIYRQIETEKNTAVVEEMPKVIKKAKSSSYSIVERLFGNNLTQFGYELFSKTSYISEGGAIPSQYKLNIGDRVRIYFWGDTFDFMSMTGSAPLEPVVTTVVDREGNLFIPNVGVVKAEGRSISQVENEITMNFSRSYTNFQVKITVSEPRDFPVLVMGNVKQPGTVYANASGTFLDALNFAGGIKKDGSLRNIIHIDSVTKKKTTIDLYELLVEGNYHFINLKKGDVILVNPIGNVVAVAEGVKRPAIYEFKNDETLAELVKYAGGLLPSVDIHTLQVEGFDQATNQKEIQSVTLTGLKTIRPKDGDMLKFRSIYKIAENLVTLQGNVKHPGEFQYENGMHLSDILKEKDELLNRTFTDQAVINRVVGEDKDIISIPVSLKAFFNGSTDPELMPQDIIKIYPATEMSMIDVAGCVENPSLIPYKKNMTLSDILSVVKLTANSNDVVVEITNNETSNDQLTYSPDVILSRGIEDNPEIGSEALEAKVSKSRKLTTVYLYDYLTKERKADLIELQTNDKVLFRLVTKEEALRTVKVLGYVNNPGVYKIKPGMKITDVISQAGGLAPNAYLKGMVFLRDTVNSAQLRAMNVSSLELQDEIITKALAAQSYAGQGESNISDFLSIQQNIIDIMKQKAEQKYGRVIIDVKDNDMASLMGYNNLELQDGDEIIIPQSPEYIMVIGEVYNQSAIVYTPDQIANFYLDQVGGMTKRARKKTTFVLKANGMVIRGRDLKRVVLDPGDSIIVPRKVKTPINFRGIISDIAQIGANAAQTVYILLKI